MEKKLFTLKKHLSLSQTAEHLSTLFDDEVTEADIFQLALDRHLKLSVNLKSIPAYSGKVVPFEKIKFYDILVSCQLSTVG